MKQKRETSKRLGRLTEAQAAVGWGIILMLIAILGTIYLSQASRTAVAGRRVQIHQNDLDTIKRENASVEKEIAESQSLDRLQTQAQQMGFVQAQPENIEYLLIPDYPVATAVPPILPSATEIEETAVPPETMEEALVLAFRASVSSLIEGSAGEQ